MPIRNPFARRNGPVAVTATTANGDGDQPRQQQRDAPGFERVHTVGSKAPSVLTIGSPKSHHDPGEYKMSVVNDSGVYLPPSPTQEKAQWPRKYLGGSGAGGRPSTDTNTRSSCDIEPFSISRESFDSYRRSFDISARSPITHDFPTRTSFDSANLCRLPRSAIDRSRMSMRGVAAAATVEEDFEEVGLDDQKQQQQQAKKRGFFSKLGVDNQESSSSTSSSSPAPGPVSRFLMTGRKRGHSGQGAELGSLDQQHQRMITATGDERRD